MKKMRKMHQKHNQKHKKNIEKYVARLLPAACLSVIQVMAAPFSALAETVEYEGTTQMSAKDFSLDVSASLQLEVEEVYVQAGDQVTAGSQLLKVTDDSYQNAQSYYEASLIKADNTLTDTQLSYDQGLLEVQYEYEKAKARADQAEFVKNYQTDELEGCITDHEEMIEALEERIAEIEAGDYGTASSGGGQSGVSGKSSASNQNKKNQDKESETDSQKTPESETGAQNGTENGITAPDSQNLPENGNAQEGSETAPSETSTEQGGQMPGEESTPSQPGDDTQDPSAPGETAPEGGEDASGSGNTEEKIAELTGKITVCAGEYEQIVTQLNDVIEKTKGASAGTSGEGDSGAESQNPASSQNESNAAQQGESTTQTVSIDTSALQSSLQSSIDGDALAKGHLSNVQQMVQNKLGKVQEIAEALGIDYGQYVSVLNTCVSQLESDIALQQEVLAALSTLSVETVVPSSSEQGSGSGGDAAEASGSSGETGASVSLEQVESLRSLAEQLVEKSRQLCGLYAELVSLQEQKIEGLNQEKSTLESEVTELKKQLAACTSSEEQSGGSGGSSGDTQSGAAPGNEQNAGGTSGDGQNSGSAQANTQNAGNQQSGMPAADGTQQQSGMPSGMPSSGLPGNADSNNMPSAGSASTGSMSMPSGISMPSGGGSFSSSSGFTQESGRSLTMEDLNLTEEDISLFGGAYDLSQYDSILEREPSDSEEAEAYLKTLKTSLRTVTEQYEELLRSRESNELKIRYNYDSLILEGELAEITYQLDQTEWEETLQEAEDAKTKLQEKKAVLDQMAGGIVSAPEDGTIASVGYEAGDILSSRTPVVYLYDTDFVTITIAVPQEEITALNVGDQVEVTISNRFTTEGVITEKSVTIQEGNARSDVKYEIEVTVDNADGFLSAGMTAVIRADI